LPLLLVTLHRPFVLRTVCNLLFTLTPGFYLRHFLGKGFQLG
jgi:hypothetical protein